MPAVEPLNYEALRKKQQLERGSPRLTRLEGSFYRDLELYLQGLQEDYQREQASNAGSAKSTLLHDELTNTRRLAEDLYEVREKKVVTAAQAAVRGGASETANMLREEQELFEALVALLRDAKRRALHRPSARPAMAAPAPAPPQPAPVVPGTLLPAPPPAPAAPAPAEQAEGRVLVRVLEDIGTFAASDLRTYHVQREDVLSLPADTARILLLRGKAVEVVPPA